jgi:hypothetical protein
MDLFIQQGTRQMNGKLDERVMFAGHFISVLCIYSQQSTLAAPLLSSIVLLPRPKTRL